MGKVGDDPFGRFLADTLRREGVDIAPLRFDRAGARTALAFVSLRADGEREFLFYRHPSADMLFDPGRRRRRPRSRRAQGASTSARSASPAENPRATRASTPPTSPGAGNLVTYDANLRLPLWPDAEAAKAGIRPGLAQAHVVKLSDEELEFLTGARDPAAVRAPLARRASSSWPSPRGRRLASG